MQREQRGSADDRDDQDREVSRRVENPTAAEPGDDAVYQAANPVADDDRGGPVSPPERGGAGGASTETAAAEIAEDNESEPTRSE